MSEQTRERLELLAISRPDDAKALGKEIDRLERELAAARAKVTAIRESCHWREDADGNWWSDCKQGYVFTADGPAENGFVWCPYCGKQLVQLAAPAGAEEGKGQ